MKKTMLCLLLALLAAPMMAGEKEVETTRAALAKLTAINDSVLGKEELRFIILGTEVGKFNIEITKGEFEGKPCYVVVASAAFALGDNKHGFTTKSMIAPNGWLLSEESTETEDGETTKSTTWTLTGGIYNVHKVEKKAKEEAERDRSSVVKPDFNLLAGSANMVIGKLLPAASETYEFRSWDSDSQATYPKTITLSALKDGIVEIKEVGTEASKDAEGGIKESVKTVSSTLKNGKFVRVDMGDRFVLSADAPAKLTPVTDEAMAKQDKEFHPVAMFFRATQTRSEDTVSKAVNLDRFMDTALEKDPRAQGLTQEQKDLVKAQQLPGLPKALLGEEKKQTDKEKSAAAATMKMILNVEHFVVSKGEGEQMIVRFTEEVCKFMGNKLEFIVEKNKEGQWQVVWVENKSDEEEGKDNG